MKKYSVLVSSIVVILLLSVASVFCIDKKYSSFEKRSLEQFPVLTIKSYWNNSFKEKLEVYLSDQIVGRDFFSGVRSTFDRLLGKKEVGDIVFGDNGYLFDKDFSFKERVFNQNIDALIKFSKKNTNTTFALIPSSSEVYKEFLPKGLVLLDEKKTIDYIYSNIEKNVSVIDLLGSFNSAKDYESLYYKTDHHWTTFGAYIAYLEYCSNKEMEPIDIDRLEKISVGGFYGTSYARAKSFFIKPDTLSYYNFSNLTLNIGNVQKGDIYDYKAFDSADKYSGFLYGNNAISTIENNHVKQNKKLLIIKDSFSNSFIPFVANNYKEVHIIDLRHYVYNLSEYMAINEFDDILILYSLKNFMQDSNIVKLKY